MRAAEQVQLAPLTPSLSSGWLRLIACGICLLMHPCPCYIVSLDGPCQRLQ